MNESKLLVKMYKIMFYICIYKYIKSCCIFVYVCKNTLLTWHKICTQRLSLDTYVCNPDLSSFVLS